MKNIRNIKKCITDGHKQKEIKLCKNKSRLTLFCVFLLCSVLLVGCGIENGGDQFTQLDTKYLKATPSDVPQQNNEEEVQATEAENEDVEKKGKNSVDNPQKDSNSTQVEQKEENAQKSNQRKETDKTTKKSSKQRDSSSKKPATAKKNKSSNSSKKKVTSNENKENSSSQNKNSNKNLSNTPKPSSDDSSGKAVCTISIDCKTILSNRKDLDSSKKSFVPEDGYILKSTKEMIESGDSVYDILNRVCRKYKIHMEAAYTPAYKTYYVEGINQLYEFDCGELSGWTYLVNGKSVNYGASKYQVKPGDVIQWRYTCNAGRDVNA